MADGKKYLLELLKIQTNIAIYFLPFFTVCDSLVLSRYFRIKFETQMCLNSESLYVIELKILTLPKFGFE